MENSQIKKLADEVSRQKTVFRNLMLQKKCQQESLEKSRVVLPREITLTPKEKESNMRSAFDKVLSQFVVEAKRELMKEIGKELNNRKKERKESSKSRLEKIIQDFEKEKFSLEELRGEILLIEKEIREEEEYRLAVATLIQKGMAILDRNNELIIFEDYSSNEDEAG